MQGVEQDMAMVGSLPGSTLGEMKQNLAMLETSDFKPFQEVSPQGGSDRQGSNDAQFSRTELALVRASTFRRNSIVLQGPT